MSEVRALSSSEELATLEEMRKVCVDIGGQPFDGKCPRCGGNLFYPNDEYTECSKCSFGYSRTGYIRADERERLLAELREKFKPVLVDMEKRIFKIQDGDIAQSLIESTAWIERALLEASTAAEEKT